MDRKSLIAKIVVKGHSATKALEIAIDLERGEEYARNWLCAIGVQ